jgi:hypothetical protein
MQQSRQKKHKTQKTRLETKDKNPKEARPKQDPRPKTHNPRPKTIDPRPKTLLLVANSS